MNKCINYGEIKKRIDRDGTRILYIDSPCLIKISTLDLLAEAMVVLGDTLERMGITQDIIEQVKKGVDSEPHPLLDDISLAPTSPQSIKESNNPEQEERRLSRRQRSDFLSFVNAVLTDEANEDVFEISEIEKVLKTKLGIKELQDEFGDDLIISPVGETSDHVLISLKLEV